MAPGASVARITGCPRLLGDRSIMGRDWVAWLGHHGWFDRRLRTGGV